MNCTAAMGGEERARLGHCFAQALPSHGETGDVRGGHGYDRYGERESGSKKIRARNKSSGRPRLHFRFLGRVR